MTSASASQAPELAIRSGPRFPLLRETSKFLRKQPLASFGAVVLVLGVVVAVVGPSVLPKDPYETSVLNSLQTPSAEHYFGTDNLGRDIFSRVILATRFSLLLGISAVIVGQVITLTIGLSSGYIGGRVDLVIQRLVDAAMGIPFILFLLLVVTMIGASFFSIAVVLGLYGGVTNSRIIRGAVLGIKEETYVEAARALGAGPVRIMARHILPNTMAPLLIIASLSLGTSILAESTLSFLGYGVPPPDPTWGQMMGSEARPYITRAPWMAIFPGAALALAVFAINVLGDGLRDTLDPRLRER